MTDCFLRHVGALTLKETRQILRDKSAVLLGVVMPILLIILFGYGLTFDIREVRLGIVNPSMSKTANALTTSLAANPTFKVQRYDSRIDGMRALRNFNVVGLLVFETTATGDIAQLLVDGIDAPRAQMVVNAVSAALQTAQRVPVNGFAQGIEVVPRVWFNESVSSRWYLIPGLFVVVMTLVGTMMTSLVIAREWERGTMEAMLATPVSPAAFLLSKLIPYFVLGMVGWILCMIAAIGLYEVPLRGSLTVILLSSALYLLMGLALGIVVSAFTRSQFLASQITVLGSFLPAVILSGFIFDLRSAPHWADTFSHLLPPVYYLELLKVGFLTGGMQTLVVKNFTVLLGFTVLFLGIAYKLCEKRVRR